MIENYNILKSLNIYLIDNSDIKFNPSIYRFETNEFKLELNPHKFNILYSIVLTKKQDFTLNNKTYTRPLNYITFKLPYFLVKNTLNDIKIKINSFEINKKLEFSNLIFEEPNTDEQLQLANEITKNDIVTSYINSYKNIENSIKEYIYTVYGYSDDKYYNNVEYTITKHFTYYKFTIRSYLDESFVKYFYIEVKLNYFDLYLKPSDIVFDVFESSSNISFNTLLDQYETLHLFSFLDVYEVEHIDVISFKCNRVTNLPNSIESMNFIFNKINSKCNNTSSNTVNKELFNALSRMLVVKKEYSEITDYLIDFKLVSRQELKLNKKNN